MTAILLGILTVRAIVILALLALALIAYGAIRAEGRP